MIDLPQAQKGNSYPIVVGENRNENETSASTAKKQFLIFDLRIIGESDDDRKDWDIHPAHFYDPDDTLIKIYKNMHKEGKMKKYLLAIFFILAGASCHFFSAKIYTIPPCALDHWESGTISFPHNRWETEFSFKTSSDYEDIVMITPVNLPHGVTVKKLTTYLTDNTDRDEARMLIILGRHNLQTAAREEMVSINTRGCAASPEQREFTASTINFARINNDKYSYYLIAIFGMHDPNLKFHGAKIYY